MKTLRQISAATILSLTLAVSVLAGHIETPGAVSTGTTTTTITTTTTTTTNLTTIIILTAVSASY